jgi:hypothetical protein
MYNEGSGTHPAPCTLSSQDVMPSTLVGGYRRFERTDCTTEELWFDSRQDAEDTFKYFYLFNDCFSSLWSIL